MKISEVELIYKNKVAAKDRIKITSVVDAYNAIYPHFDKNKIGHKEFFFAAFINRNNHLLGVVKIAEGGISSCEVDCKIIFQAAYKLNASGIIVAHNHPSGNLNVSQNDKDFTNKLKQICDLLEFTLMDSLIVVPEKNKYTSIIN